MNEDAVLPQPRGALDKGPRLVHIGEEEVVDEDKELVGRLRFGLAELLNVPLVGGRRGGVLIEVEVRYDGGLGHVPGEPPRPGAHPEAPCDELVGEVEPKGTRQDEGEGGEDADGHESLAEVPG